MQATRERRTARGLSPPPSFGDPSGDRLRISPALTAQPRGTPGERLVQFALRRALKDTGDLGQQIRPAARKLAQRGDRGGFLVAAQLAPFRVMPRLAVDVGDEKAVSLRALVDHTF